MCCWLWLVWSVLIAVVAADSVSVCGCGCSCSCRSVLFVEWLVLFGFWLVAVVVVSKPSKWMREWFGRVDTFQTAQPAGAGPDRDNDQNTAQKRTRMRKDGEKSINGDRKRGS